MAKAKKEIKQIKLSDMTVEELKKEVKSLKVQVAKTGLELKMGKVKNLKSVFLLRKKIAQALTELTKKVTHDKIKAI